MKTCKVSKVSKNVISRVSFVILKGQPENGHIGTARKAQNTIGEKSFGLLKTFVSSKMYNSQVITKKI